VGDGLRASRARGLPLPKDLSFAEMIFRFRFLVLVFFGILSSGPVGCGSAARADRPSLPEIGASVAPVIQPGAPGTPGRVLDRDALEDLPRPAPTEADVQFMQNMMLHHAQALEMVLWVPERSQREDIRRLALRIELSQGAEIAQMRRWLEDRWEDVPSLGADPSEGHAGHPGHADHASGHTAMPGMLTPGQLQQLQDARGEAFDRLFLESMIFHHEGAILMVAELFSAFGAAQGGEIYEFASHVDSDQRMEIERMHGLLRTLP
jgi:uncharacterized protein (DUF305 family)